MLEDPKLKEGLLRSVQSLRVSRACKALRVAARRDTLGW